MFISCLPTLAYAPPSTLQQLNKGVRYAVANPAAPKFNETGYGFRGEHSGCNMVQVSTGTVLVRQSTGGRRESHTALVALLL